MFPLGTVLLPSALLPLHVFEPRYRALVRDCLAGDREFGVVLIERGSEVGGGDVRFDVGTRARIVEAAELDDGRWVLILVGDGPGPGATWLPDDPYPRAEVERLRRRAGGRRGRRAGATTLERRAAPGAGPEGRAGRGGRAGDRRPRAPTRPRRLAGGRPGPPRAPRPPAAFSRPDAADERLTLVAALLEDEADVLAQRWPGDRNAATVASRSSTAKHKTTSLPGDARELWQLVVAYAKQETIEPDQGPGPLRRLRRWPGAACAAWARAARASAASARSRPRPATSSTATGRSSPT